MSNRHYVKKKPQNKSYSPSGICNNYLSSDDNGSIENSSIGPIYEQIKSEVVSSVLNWLSMYMAADQEDKKVNEQANEPIHCCECTLKKRNEKSNRSLFNSPISDCFDFKSPKENECVRFKEIGTSTTNDESSLIMKSSDIPEDSNMIMTEFKAGQVWPDWCKYLEKSSDKNLASSQVYYDKFNDRLCVYRRGLVEYPQLRKQSPRIDNTNIAFKQNLKAIPEVRESLNKNNDILKDALAVTPKEYYCGNDGYLLNPHYKEMYQFPNMHINDGYDDMTNNQLPNCQNNENFPSNMVKWTSLPNVQFQH